MAEGFARKLLGSSIEPYSAGTEPQRLNELAVRVMLEVGVDISSHHSKSLKDLSGTKFDLIVTVCDSAAAKCPASSQGNRTVHVPFDDPPRLAENSKDEEETLGHYRRVRDEIGAFILTLPELLNIEV